MTDARLTELLEHLTRSLAALEAGLRRVEDALRSVAPPHRQSVERR